jgi:hypothetical protein
MKFQLLYLCYDDPPLLVNANFTVFERIRELSLSRIRKISCLLAQNPQKIFNSGTINTVQ